MPSTSFPFAVVVAFGVITTCIFLAAWLQSSGWLLLVGAIFATGAGGMVASGEIGKVHARAAMAALKVVRPDIETMPVGHREFLAGLAWDCGLHRIDEPDHYSVRSCLWSAATKPKPRLPSGFSGDPMEVLNFILAWDGAWHSASAENR
ncbi:hypothetical protein [Luteimonas sp. MHLX1A]|uniref:hypothetical protein n=1 Tax=Alterluteimonas muca TaxID=2878684 RepID=UPI001E532CB8|nr:hypothetical protein [Luteimonas sp. MHLX1A]MCD9046752.1 hypothetical protein [Luteimonas sp. MHLX1A]